MRECETDEQQLEAARAEIAQVDVALAELFKRRMMAAEHVASYKAKRGLPVVDEAQRERVLARARNDFAAAGGSAELSAYYVRAIENIVALSEQYQFRLMEGVRTAYNGVPGAFAHIAATRIFPSGQAVAYSSFDEAYKAVQSGECDNAVLPIENSYAGEVGQVVDLVFFGDLHINGVYDLRIVQNLLGVPGASLSEVTTAISHPQALAQCEPYLRKLGIRAEEASSTAAAATLVAQRGDVHCAAIASEETADLYGLRLLDHDINKSDENTTRFVVLSRVPNESVPSTMARQGTFILLFSVNNETGALVRALNVIGNHGFNMKKLRSRPIKDRPWQYYFYVEAEGDERSESAKQMIEELANVCDVIKIAGNYGKEAKNLS